MHAHRQMVGARLREAVDGPLEAVVGGVLARANARGGRGRRALRRLHERHVGIGDIALAAEHQRRGDEHEDHDPEREPRLRLQAAGRRDHAPDGTHRGGGVRRWRRAALAGRNGETVGVDDLLERVRDLPCGRRLLAAAAAVDGAYLVGGAVRDLLLGRVPKELDIVVEGDVGALAAALGAPSTAHERFGTATVRDGDCRWDLAAARAEDYAQPGRAARRAPGGHRGGPAAPRPDDQRDRARPAQRRAARGRRTRSTTSPPGACGSCTTRACATIRRACGGSRATARAWASRSSRTPPSLRPRRSPPAPSSGCRARGSATSCGSRSPSADPVAALEEAVRLGLAPWLAPDRARTEAALALLPAGEGRPDLVVLAAALDEGADDADQRLAGMAFTANERAVLRAAARAPAIAAVARDALRPSEPRARPARAAGRSARARRRRRCRRVCAALARRAASRRARDRRGRPHRRGDPARPADRPPAGVDARHGVSMASSATIATSSSRPRSNRWLIPRPGPSDVRDACRWRCRSWNQPSRFALTAGGRTREGGA